MSLTAERILAMARAKQKTLPAARRRNYALLEALTGGRANVAEQEPVRAFSGRALPAAPKKKESLATRLDNSRKEIAPRHKFQQLIEATVKTLLITASEEGDLTFRADVDAGVMNDLSVDVMLEGKQIVITFYTEDASVRRLLQGYERELVSHMQSRGLRVRKVNYKTAPDDSDPPAVPVHSK